MHSLRDRENLNKILEQKVDSAVRGELLSQQKFFEAEAEVKARNWEREILTSLFTRLIRNLTLSDFSYIKELGGRSKLKETKLAFLGNRI